MKKILSMTLVISTLTLAPARSHAIIAGTIAFPANPVGGASLFVAGFILWIMRDTNRPATGDDIFGAAFDASVGNTQLNLDTDLNEKVAAGIVTAADADAIRADLLNKEVVVDFSQPEKSGLKLVTIKYLQATVTGGQN